MAIGSENRSPPYDCHGFHVPFSKPAHVKGPVTANHEDRCAARVDDRGRGGQAEPAEILVRRPSAAVPLPRVHAAVESTDEVGDADAISYRDRRRGRGAAECHPIPAVEIPPVDAEVASGHKRVGARSVGHEPRTEEREAAQGTVRLPDAAGEMARVRPSVAAAHDDVETGGPDDRGRVGVANPPRLCHPEKVPFVRCPV